jgi:hypothetical protein
LDLDRCPLSRSPSARTQGAVIIAGCQKTSARSRRQRLDQCDEFDADAQAWERLPGFQVLKEEAH